jgi:uncharacterized delta-60 repeat protein
MTLAGALDPTFGNGTGAYFAPSGFGGGFQPSSIAVAPDDSTFVAGYVFNNGTTGDVVSLAHLTASGALDTSFGNGGVASLTPSGLPAGTQITTANVLLRPDGTIIVDASDKTGDAILAAFNLDGTADTSFGNNGVAVFTLASLGLPAGSLSTAALQPDNKVVVAGVFALPKGASAPYDAALIRVDAGGMLDTSFGSGGVVKVLDNPLNGTGLTPLESESIGGIAVQPSGQILVALDFAISGTSGLGVQSCDLVGLNSDGSRNMAFETNFFANFAPYTLGQLIAEPDGTILVAGEKTFENNNTLSKLNPDGSLDQSFTFSGFDTNSYALESNGDILVTSGLSGATPTNSFGFQVIRLTPNLTMDETFGSGGTSTQIIALPAGAAGTTTVYPYFSTGIAVGPNNAPVVLGSFADSSFFAVARLTATGSAALPGDFTGDGIADPAIYLPAAGAFAVRSSQGGPDQITTFGISGPGATIPAVGNYNGTGVEEIAAYLPSQGEFAIRPSTGGPDEIIPFGLSGPGQTIPTPGDYFGTGQDDIAAYLPSIGAFAIRNPAGGPDEIIPFGLPGLGQSIPVPGDYDGSGKTEIAVYLPSLGEFAYRPANGGPDVFVSFGIAGLGQTIPTPGHFDGSGHDEIAAYLPSLGEFVYRPADGGADQVIPFGLPGPGQTIPMVADYDGSGHDEIAAYLPSLGIFAYRPDGLTVEPDPSSVTPDVLEQFGVAGLGYTLPVTGASVSLVPGVIPWPGTGSVSANAVDASVSAESIDLPNIVELDPVSTSTKKHTSSQPPKVATLVRSDLPRGPQWTLLMDDRAKVS